MAQAPTTAPVELPPPSFRRRWRGWALWLGLPVVQLALVEASSYGLITMYAIGQAPSLFDWIIGLFPAVFIFAWLYLGGKQLRKERKIIREARMGTGTPGEIIYRASDPKLSLPASGFAFYSVRDNRPA